MITGNNNLTKKCEKMGNKCNERKITKCLIESNV